MRFREGNLREYLQKNHTKLTLKNRIAIFNNLCESINGAYCNKTRQSKY